jgi:hypothetical protein
MLVLPQMESRVHFIGGVSKHPELRLFYISVLVIYPLGCVEANLMEQG